MKTASSIREFEQMLAEKQAIVFIQARWSSYAMRTLGFLQLLESRVNSNAVKFAVDFAIWEIDLSDQTGDIWNAAQTWLQPQCNQYDLLMWGGWGSILWCSRGAVLKSIVQIEQLINIVEITRETFTSRVG